MIDNSVGRRRRVAGAASVWTSVDALLAEGKSRRLGGDADPQRAISARQLFLCLAKLRSIHESESSAPARGTFKDVTFSLAARALLYALQQVEEWSGGGVV